jgi:four helix bundle protein
MKRTSNAERRTSNIELSELALLLHELPTSNYDGNGKTPNAQRPTSNAQLQKARFDLEERLLEFSARIIEIVDALPNTRAANHIAGQLLRCGTSPYGNHGEVEAAESRRDFVHKLRVCLKELKETRRWLRLVRRVKFLPEQKIAPVLSEAEQLTKIFFASIRTAERNGG